MSTETIKPAHFTADQVMAALEAVVEGNENYIDPRSLSLGLVCKYVVDGEPSCIVGQVLARLGVPAKILGYMDASIDPMVGGDAIKVLNQNGFTLEPKALAMLIRAQSEQDGCHTWDVALEGAREVYRGYASA